MISRFILGSATVKIASAERPMGRANRAGRGRDYHVQKGVYRAERYLGNDVSGAKREKCERKREGE
jgi:hypothetical protein